MLYILAGSSFELKSANRLQVIIFNCFRINLTREKYSFRSSEQEVSRKIGSVDGKVELIIGNFYSLNAFFFSLRRTGTF